MDINGMTFTDVFNAIYEYLTDYEQKCILDVLTGFGRDYRQLDTMLYVWYGMNHSAFLNDASNGFYYE